jgi:hypothetical protein
MMKTIIDLYETYRKEPSKENAINLFNAMGKLRYQNYHSAYTPGSELGNLEMAMYQKISACNWLAFLFSELPEKMQADKLNWLSESLGDRWGDYGEELRFYKFLAFNGL